MSRSRIRVRFYDPAGARYGIPTYPWGMAPANLATYRQLAVVGLRPGGQGVQAQLLWASRRYRAPGGVRVAYLYDLDLAKPKRIPSPRQRAALARATAARRLCPACGTDRGYVLSRRLGKCLECATPWEVAAA